MPSPDCDSQSDWRQQQLECGEVALKLRTATRFEAGEEEAPKLEYHGQSAARVESATDPSVSVKCMRQKKITHEEDDIPADGPRTIQLDIISSSSVQPSDQCCLSVEAGSNNLGSTSVWCPVVIKCACHSDHDGSTAQRFAPSLSSLFCACSHSPERQLGLSR